jgi:outer membrane protein OmpA-like peptidoglycan-associated protein
MKFLARMIATVAVAVSLTPAPFLHAMGSAASTDPVAGTPVEAGQVDAGQPAPKRKEHGKTPKVELFVGYSHFRGVPTLNSENRMVGLNGGNASIAFNLNRYFGLVGDVGGYHASQLRLSGPGAVPTRTVDADGKAYTYMFGPRFSFRNRSRFTPFVQALFGGIHASDVRIDGCRGALCAPLPEQDAFAMTAGAGLDIRIFRHVSIRALQAEYMMTRFGALNPGDSASQNDLRLSSGLVFRFGGNAPPPPVNRAPMASCSADSKTIYAGSGESVAVHAQASDPDNDLLNYSWTASSGTVEGSGADVRWNSSGVPAGSYRVSAHAADGRGGMADCSADVRVEAKPNQLPVLSCSVDHASVAAGEPVQVSATASDADNDPLTYSWNASGGQVVGSGSSVRFDTTGLTTNRYVVTGHVDDGRETKPDAHLTLEGHADPRGSVEYNQALSERRIESTKQFLIGRGVPADKIEAKAFGVQQNLTDAQVRDAVEHNSELQPAERQKMLDNMTTIILASNRRVDVTLSTTGQRSLRQYPFNATDSMSLLRQQAADAPASAAKRKAKPSAR